jgi:predicted dehydrogenase
VPDRIRLGVVGASAERGWACWTHRPALAATPAFEVTAVAGSSPHAAAAAAPVWGARYTCHDPHELIAHDEVDAVVLAVVLPRRQGLAEAAASAGKHVYCEWPFAEDLDEALRLRGALAAAGVRSAVGLQTRHHPAVRHLADLVADGWIGEPLSASLTFALSTPATWPERHRWMAGSANVSRLAVVGGHSLDVLGTIVGPFQEVAATLATRVPVAVLDESGEEVPDPLPDQILLTGTTVGGVATSVHITTGSPAGAGYRIELHGRTGRLVMVSDDDSLIGPEFTLLGSQGRAPLHRIALPAAYRSAPPTVPIAVANVCRVYAGLAEAIHTGTRVPPDADTAVELHALLAAIVESSATGHRVRIDQHRR